MGVAALFPQGSYSRVDGNELQFRSKSTLDCQSASGVNASGVDLLSFLADFLGKDISASDFVQRKDAAFPAWSKDVFEIYHLPVDQSLSFSVLEFAANPDVGLSLQKRAEIFMSVLPKQIRSPRITVTDDEAILLWKSFRARAVVIFEKEHPKTYGYALWRRGRFVPGDNSSARQTDLADDLNLYLRQNFKK